MFLLESSDVLVFSRSANDLSTCRRNLAHLANSSWDDVLANSALFLRTSVRSLRCLLAVDERNIREYVENAYRGSVSRGTEVWVKRG